MVNLLQPLLIASVYLVLAAAIGRRLRKDHNARSPGVVIQTALAFNLALHLLLVGAQIFVNGEVRLGFENSVGLAAAGVTAVFLATSWFRPVSGLAVIILPVAAVSLLGMAFPVTNNDAAIPASGGLLTHIIFSLCAYGLLTLAALQALVTAYQDRQLHLHRSGTIVRALPPLQAMERILFQLIAWGFVLLTLSLGTGWLFLDGADSPLGLLEKSLLSICAWVMFGVLLLGRIRLGWRGQTAVRWTLAGFIALAAAYFGTKILVTLFS